MPQLHETLMGRKLIEHTLPEIGDQLKRIADALEKQSAERSTIEIAVCYYINDETGEKVYDVEHMFNELDRKIQGLEKTKR
jgi:hypothetical protein